VNNLLVNIFNMQTFTFLSLLIDFLGILNDLGDVCLPWKSALLFLEVPDGSQRDVKLLGAAKESAIRGLQRTILRGGSRVVQALG
jgi:hypothetical protein